MKVAVISRGESAIRTWPAHYRESYFDVIAVNSAIDLFSADWLVASDPSNALAARGRPRLGLATRKDLLQPGSEMPDFGDEILVLDQSIGTTHGVPKHVSYSLEAALYLAVDFLSATRIDVFGADRGWPGEAQTASTEPGLGIPGGSTYHQDRWNREAKCMTRTLDDLRDRAYIHRITE